MRSFLFLLLTCFSYSIGAAIDEYKTDIYFANGIDTQRFEARNNALNSVLKPSVIEEIFLGSLDETNKHIGKFDLAYNETHGMGVDLFESALQKVSTGIDSLDEVILGSLAKTLRAGFLAELVSATKSNTIHDRETKIKAYKESIEAGHGVLTITHSQGNFFTNEAFESLDLEFKDG